MDMRRLLVIAGTALAAISMHVAPHAQGADARYVQMAEIEIDPAQLEPYQAAVKEQIEAAIRLEPGVLVLYAVSQRDNPSHIRVFEIYRDMAAYRSHLESTHFKKYKATTQNMVKSLSLVQMNPIKLGAK